MSIPGSLLQRAVLQPRVSNGFTTFCGVNGDGTRVAVGWDTGSQRGVATFVRRGTSWEEIQDLGLTADLDGELNAVAMDGTGKLIACGDCYNAAPAGKVCVYAFNAVDDDITQQATLTPAGAADQYFGAACCFNSAGTRLYVGAPGYNHDAGAVYVYERVGAVWTQTAIITIVGSEALGSAVAVNQDETLLAIGAKEADYWWGKAFLLAKDGGGVFQLRDTLLPPGDFGGEFGSGLALAPNGQRLYVGLPRYGDSEQRQGVILTLDYANGTWHPVASQRRLAPWAWENLGLNLALSHDGSRLVSGLQASALVYDAYQYRVAGITKDDNDQPAPRQVFLHDRATGEQVDSVMSGADGTFALASFTNEPHVAICTASAGGVRFNALVLDEVIPQ